MRVVVSSAPPDWSAELDIPWAILVSEKNQLFSVSVSAPLQSMALDVVLLLYPETYHL